MKNIIIFILILLASSFAYVFITDNYGADSLIYRTINLGIPLVALIILIIYKYKMQKRVKD